MSDQIVYHAFRGQLIGDTLVPLSMLRHRYSLRPLYEQQLEKYIGREQLLDVCIPSLDCTWKEVLFLSAIPPSEVLDQVANAIQEVNHLVTEGFTTFRASWQSLSLHLSNLDPSCLAVYFPKQGYPKEHDFLPFSQDLWDRLTNFPAWTKQYYRTILREGQTPLYWNGLPHILYKGEIAIDRGAITPV